MLSDAQLNFNRKMREIVDYGELLIIFALCEWDVVAFQNKKKKKSNQACGTVPHKILLMDRFGDTLCINCQSSGEPHNNTIRGFPNENGKG